MNNYELDLTGLNPNNLVVEMQTTSLLNNSYRVIIPKATPFFLDNLTVKELGTTPRVLTKGVHYDVGLPFMAASRFIAKQLYGCLVILDPTITGTLEIGYQTLGGVYTSDYQELLEQLIERSINPRIVYYDQLINMPAYFPPVPHNEDAGNFTYKHLIEKITELTNIVANKAVTERAYILYRPATEDEVLDEESTGVVLTPSNTALILKDILTRLNVLEQQIT